MSGYANGYKPPHNPEAEASILGGIILKNEALGVVADLEVDDFYDLKNRVVFQAIRQLAEAGMPIDVVLLEAQLGKLGKLDAVGGVGYLGELTLRVPTVENVESYAAIVRRDARIRRATADTYSAYETIARGAHEPAEALSELHGEIGRLLEQERGSRAGSITGGQRWIEPLDAFLGDEEPDDDDSADWIFRDIVPRGEAALLAGPPKCGKTWAMLGMGIDAALGKSWLDLFDNTTGGPIKVLCLAFEDGKRRLRKRVWELVRARGLTPNDHTLRAHLSIGREPLSLPGDERAFAAELKAWRPQLVLIDNLTRVMAGDQNAIKDAKRFGDLWVKLCSDVGAAVVFLHHTNKVGPIAPGQRNQGDPFELIRGSSDLVAAARHLVLMRPLESPDAVKLSDVRMRGNLDLRREDFVLGFERARVIDRWTATLSHRGETEAVHDELEAKRREKQAARKAAKGGRSGADGVNSVDERIYAKLVELDRAGARNLATLEQLRTSCGVRAQEVRPAIDRLLHAGRVRQDAVKRFEGTSWRSRAIFVPAESGG